MKTNAKPSSRCSSRSSAGAAFWMLVLSPKREEIATLTPRSRSRSEAAQAAEAQAATYAKAQDNATARTTRRSCAWARPCRVTTTSARCSSSSTRPPRRRRSTSRPSTSSPQSSRRPARHHGRAGGRRAGAAARRRVDRQRPASRPCPSPSPSAAGYFRLTDFMDRLEDFVTVQNENIGVSGRLLLIGSIAIQPATAAATGRRLVRAEGGHRRSRLSPPARQDVTGAAAPSRRRWRRGRRHDAGLDHPAYHDNRDHHRSPMSALTNLWRQLQQRRLLPVAILMVAALVAVPFVLAKDPEPVPQAPPPWHHGRAQRPDRGPDRHGGRRGRRRAEQARSATPRTRSRSRSQGRRGQRGRGVRPRHRRPVRTRPPATRPADAAAPDAAGRRRRPARRRRRRRPRRSRRPSRRRRTTATTSRSGSATPPESRRG